MFCTEMTGMLQVRQSRRSQVRGLEGLERPGEERDPPTTRGEHCLLFWPWPWITRVTDLTSGSTSVSTASQWSISASRLQLISGDNLGKLKSKLLLRTKINSWNNMFTLLDLLNQFLKQYIYPLSEGFKENWKVSEMRDITHFDIWWLSRDWDFFTSGWEDSVILSASSSKLSMSSMTSMVNIFVERNEVPITHHQHYILLDHSSYLSVRKQGSEGYKYWLAKLMSSSIVSYKGLTMLMNILRVW